MIIYMLYVVYMCVIKSLFGNSFVSVNKYHCGSDFHAGKRVVALKKSGRPKEEWSP